MRASDETGPEGRAPAAQLACLSLTPPWTHACQLGSGVRQLNAFNSFGNRNGEQSERSRAQCRRRGTFRGTFRRMIFNLFKYLGQARAFLEVLLRARPAWIDLKGNTWYP